jgi:opacity protein-like surface antigen
MKRVLLSAAIAAGLAVSAAAIAQDSPQKPDAMKPAQSQQAAPSSIRGTITSVDNTAKSFVVKDDASGKDVTVYWDSSTKVNGDVKVGNAVTLQTTDQSGRTMATSIDAKAAAKKPY